MSADAHKLHAKKFLLFHHLDINLGHVNLLVELWRKFGLPEQLLIHTRGHF